MIGHQIWKERKAQGLTREQLAEKAGVGISIIDTIQQDGNWRIKQLQDVAYELGFDVEVTLKEIKTGSR